MAHLLLIENGRLKCEIQILGDSVRIGREQSSQVRLGDPTVSRYHAEIFRRGGSYFLEDKKSTNGTRLNGKLVAEKSILQHKDKIAIGNAVLIFEKDDAGRVESTHDAFDGTSTVYDLLKHK